MNKDTESNSSERQQDISKQKKESGWTLAVVTSLVSVLIGSAATIGAQHWITYQEIERPKMELEIKKVAIEAHKQASSLRPNIDVSCSAESIDEWTWKVDCSTKNSGAYHADVTLTGAELSLSTDTKECLYKSGNGFTVEFPNKKQTYRTAPGTTTNAWMYIKFDQAKYKEGMRREDLVARVVFKYNTISSAQAYFLKLFPDLADSIKDAANDGCIMHVDLPAPQNK